MDLRIKRTRKMLREALWAGILEKGYDKLTVKEICERAMINRTTFYKHYEDMEDLLLRGLDEFFDEIYALGVPACPPDELEDLVLKGPLYNFVLFLRFARERADFLRLMLSEKGPSSFLIRLRRYIEGLVLERTKASMSSDAVPLLPLKLAAAAWTGEIIGMLIWWLEQGEEYSAEEMAYYLTALMHRSIYRCLGVNEPKLGFSLEEKLEEFHHPKSPGPKAIG